MAEIRVFLGYRNIKKPQALYSLQLGQTNTYILHHTKYSIFSPELPCNIVVIRVDKRQASC